MISLEFAKHLNPARTLVPCSFVFSGSITLQVRLKKALFSCFLLLSLSRLSIKSCVHSVHLSQICIWIRETFSLLLKLQIDLLLVKQVMTGVGVNLDSHVQQLSGKVRGGTWILFSRLYSQRSPLARCPLRRGAAVVIGYDMGSTGRERGRIWMRRPSSSSLLFSNRLPCSFPASAHRCYRSNICTDRIPHSPSSTLCGISFIKIGHKCPNEVCMWGALQQSTASLAPSSEARTTVSQILKLQKKENYLEQRKRIHLSLTCYIKSNRLFPTWEHLTERGQSQLHESHGCC